MSTWQSMKFQNETGEFFEVFEYANGSVIFRMNRSGDVKMDGKYLIELRKWVNIQLSKMPPPAKQK